MPIKKEFNLITDLTPQMIKGYQIV